MATTLRFHGAAREVTGSMHLIQTNGHTVALDCGLFQGRRQEANARNRTFPWEPAAIDAVVLSHAHIDHCGKLPRLVHGGFAGPIYGTPATCDLAKLLLADSAHIQQEDAEYWNRKRVKRGDAPIEPLYTEDDVEETVKLLQPRRLGEPFDAVPGVTVTLHEAGHMLGSAGMLIELAEPLNAGPTRGGSSSAGDSRRRASAGGSRPAPSLADGVLRGGTRRLVFTGDVGRLNMPILRDPAPLPACDFLICESTYGGRDTPDNQHMAEQLAEVINDTVNRGGKLIVPAFAVGRTQVIVYHFRLLVHEGRIPAIPLIVDSPLAIRATEVFRRHPEVYDLEAAAFRRVTGDLFKCPDCEYTRSVEQSKALHARKEPMIIVSASGMCEAGRILHHLKNNLEDPRNTVLIVGYQAAHTLGRRLVEKHKRVRIFGETYEVRARVKTLNGFSAHANAGELVAWTAPLARSARQVFLVHGELDQAEALASRMRERGFAEVLIPESGQSFDL